MVKKGFCDFETYEEMYEAFLEDCEEIAYDCEEEGYPAYGSNYDLRCESLWEHYKQMCPWFFDDEEE